MVPAVVNFVASKGKEGYSGFISEFACIKCRGFSVRTGRFFPQIWNFFFCLSEVTNSIKVCLLQNGEKDIEVSDFWKRRPRAGSPLKRWRKVQSKSAINGTKIEKNGEEDMSLLKFLAIVSFTVVFFKNIVIIDTKTGQDRIIAFFYLDLIAYMTSFDTRSVTSFSTIISKKKFVKRQNCHFLIVTFKFKLTPNFVTVNLQKKLLTKL